MVKLRIRVILFVGVLIASITTASEKSLDWPQFRGPTAQGIAAKADLPIIWDANNNVTWKTPIPGTGWSSPVIYNGSVYLTSAIEDKDGNPTSLYAIRVDAVTGKILWNRTVFEPKGSFPKNDKNSNASPTPIIENDRLYVHFGHLGIACLDTDGNIIWRNSDLTYDPYHGNGGSPAIVDDKIIFTCDGAERPFVAALKKNTGKLAWKVDRKETGAKNKFSFCTPLLIEYNARKELICPGSGAVCAYDPENANLLWFVDYGSGFSVIPRPVFGNGLLFIASGFADKTIYAIRPGGSGNVTDSHVVWKTNSDTPMTPSMLLVGEELYYFSDNGAAVCVDALTGNRYWRNKLGAKFSASPIFAQDRIYISSEKGKTFVIKADKKFQLLAENDLKQKTFASPAVSADMLFIRTESHLYRIEKQK